ncbi:MAG: hypothetical protein ACRC2T_10140 [Thermoguttaceae bacterium]
MATSMLFADAIKEGMTIGVRGLTFQDAVEETLNEFRKELEEYLKSEYPRLNLRVRAGKNTRNPQNPNFDTAQDQVEEIKKEYKPSPMDAVAMAWRNTLAPCDTLRAPYDTLRGKTVLVVHYYGIFVICKIGNQHKELCVLEYEFRRSSGRFAIKYGMVNVSCETEDELREALKGAIRSRGIAVAEFMRNCQREADKLQAEQGGTCVSKAEAT